MSLIPFGFWAASGGGGAAGGFDLLETTILTTTASSVTFDNLDAYSGYRNLQIRIVARSNVGAGNSSLVGLGVNGDTGSNYVWHFIRGTGSIVQSDAGTNKTSMERLFYIPGPNATANAFGSGVIDILDFSSSSKNTTARALGGEVGADSQIALASGAFFNTAAVTSLEIKDLFGSFIATSRFSLYGSV